MGQACRRRVWHDRDPVDSVRSLCQRAGPARGRGVAGGARAALRDAGRAGRGPAARESALALLNQGRAELAEGDTDGASGVLERMQALKEQIELAYELRIVSRPGEQSGVWRIPDISPDARNYYLIVEAVGEDGDLLELPVVNEEDGRTYQVTKWGLRVDEAVFERVAADKQDDGIIQDNRFGIKRPGYLAVDYLVPTTGRAITSW
ncbi:MAG: DUF6384 family protein [Gammaproteobacteria bacterium]|nr:DUF6384 family protein [Gammaproteobacteria bacterium]